MIYLVKLKLDRVATDAFLAFLLLFFILVFSSPFAKASDETFLTLMNEKKLTEAIFHLEQKVKTDPQLIFQTETLFNFGLAYWQLGRDSLALAYFIELKSRFPFEPNAKQAFDFIKQEKPQLLGSLTAFPFPIVPVNWTLTLFGLTWFGFALSFVLKRQVHAKPAAPQRNLPRLILAGLSLILALISTYQVFKIRHWSTLITESSASLLSRPDSEAPALAELGEGQTVQILDFVPSNSPDQKSWAQLQLPNGLRGWTPVENISLLAQHPQLFYDSWSKKFQKFPLR